VLQIFVFSYNRNRHLLNLLNSIYRNFKVDYSCYIIDDVSNDELTKMIIEAYSYVENFQVVYPSQLVSNYRVGNLHSNMNYVIENLMREEGYSLFIQDDLQIVCEVSKETIDSYINIVKLHPSPFLNVMFSKYNKPDLFDTSSIKDGFYYKKLNIQEKELRCFTDNMFCDNLKLKQSGFRVKMSENISDLASRELFGPLPFANNPIMMFCIQPKYYTAPRSKRSLLNRYLDKVNGLYLFYLDLTQEDIEELRINNKVPIADNYLRYKEDNLKNYC